MASEIVSKDPDIKKNDDKYGKYIIYYHFTSKNCKSDHKNLK